jgi:hypothetical protein
VEAFIHNLELIILLPCLALEIKLTFLAVTTVGIFPWFIRSHNLLLVKSTGAKMLILAFSVHW